MCLLDKLRNAVAEKPVEAVEDFLVVHEILMPSKPSKRIKKLHKNINIFYS